MKEYRYPSIKTTRYYLNDDPNKPHEFVWFCLHGYGQQARFFARKFETIAPEKHLIVVPEAQSRYYLDGTKGRVGATWMTKEDRQQDISDYVRYLDDLAADIIRTNKQAKIVVLGFSQGAATASRWCNQGAIRADFLCLWSGAFPPDLVPDGQFKKRPLKTWVVYGNEDPYLKDERLLTSMDYIKNFRLKTEEHRFKGGHEIKPEALEWLRLRLESYS